ncbi:hypothetical protein SAMN05421687_104274 [Salimicrobium flavidum]|uniref:Uncharacterized protein n=1 Tax=Salimicrobium flavidum TaxID=570947 RepID=A0A1N7JAN6_9BACI|nr:hypothetical protein SAMN05421687_104274 [Salimicrobium flavidum]
MNVVEWLYLYLAGIGLVSLAPGIFVVKKTGQAAGGFAVTLWVSLMLLIFLFRWFHSAASDIFMGTIPWIFNQVFVIGLYLLYILIIWFLLKKFSVRK